MRKPLSVLSHEYTCRTTPDADPKRVVVLALHGDVDLIGAERLVHHLRATERSNPDAIVIDLRKVGYVGGALVGILSEARDRGLADGRELSIVRSRVEVHRVFESLVDDGSFHFIDEPSAWVSTLPQPEGNTAAAGVERDPGPLPSPGETPAAGLTH